MESYMRKHKTMIFEIIISLLFILNPVLSYFILVTFFQYLFDRGVQGAVLARGTPFEIVIYVLQVISNLVALFILYKSFSSKQQNLLVDK